MKRRSIQTLTVDARLRLRAVGPADAPGLFALIDAQRAFLRRWLPWVDETRREDDTRAFIELAKRQWQAGQGFEFVIERDQELCGAIGLNRIERANRLGSIGYWLRSDRQGLGIMTSSCRRLIGFGFDELGLNRLVLAAAVDNRPSRSVAERLGFALEGVFREAEWVNDRFVDHARYALLRRDWQDRLSP
jgi:ribosomal-protein-serine acetyltransferase